jgi:5-(carboxyamino)imidazole ribonucleotide synthase
MNFSVPPPYPTATSDTTAHHQARALGVMGGGQLGRMFAQAAQRLGYEVVALDPDADCPAALVNHQHIAKPYDDHQGLQQLARLSGAVTTEFENVPATALHFLSGLTRITPNARAVAICQDRAQEKALFDSNQVPCAKYKYIEEAQQIPTISTNLLPGILKTARMGYDGKGQVIVRSLDELHQAWLDLGSVPCILEALLPLKHEISVIVARSVDGEIVNLPVQQNLHINGILAVTQVPAPDISYSLQKRAIDHARHLAQGLDYVGVLCVEFFILQDGSLLANEMAPRPHNSGHYSIDACDVSQFELQVRTLANCPLVQPRLHSSAIMLNLLGDLWLDENQAIRTPPWHAILKIPGAHLHLYGKTQARAGRKMGHITFTGPTPEAVKTHALQASELLGLPAF